MIYVLIVMTYIGGTYADGATIAMQEFSSLETCEGARRELLSRASDWKVAHRYKPFCIPK